MPPHTIATMILISYRLVVSWIRFPLSWPPRRVSKLAARTAISKHFFTRLERYLCIALAQGSHLSWGLNRWRIPGNCLGSLILITEFQQRCCLILMSRDPSNFHPVREQTRVLNQQHILSTSTRQLLTGYISPAGCHAVKWCASRHAEKPNIMELARVIMFRAYCTNTARPAPQAR